jgi:hypothetical protein
MGQTRGIFQVGPGASEQQNLNHKSPRITPQMVSNPTSEPILNPTNTAAGEPSESVELKGTLPAGDASHGVVGQEKPASETTSTAADSEENGAVKIVEDVEKGPLDAEKATGETPAPVAAGPGPPPDGGETVSPKEDESGGLRTCGSFRLAILEMCRRLVLYAFHRHWERLYLGCVSRSWAFFSVLGNSRFS